MRDVKEVVVSCSMGLPSSAGLVVTQSPSRSHNGIPTDLGTATLEPQGTLYSFSWSWEKLGMKSRERNNFSQKRVFISKSMVFEEWDL